MSENRRVLVRLSVFAVAMAYLEAAVVVYLRRIYYPEDPLSLFPLKVWDLPDLLIELGREAATIVMLLGAAWMAARGMLRRFAAFVFLFGVWDIFYYLWLKILIGWPVSWLEWDILFLIPWAWLGPWLTPVFMAFLFVAWGGWVIGTDPPCRFGRAALFLFLGGCSLVLLAFLQPAFPLLAAGPEGLAEYRPGRFSWGIYGLGMVLTATGLAATLRPSPD